MSTRGFRRFSVGVLTYNLAVVGWGAFVRATGSGAGCGRHWPLCNGEVLPRGQALETLIEFTHRVTSGISVALAGVLAVWAFRVYARHHRVRKAAVASFVFLMMEALIGAGLVLLRLVAHDASAGRGVGIVLHLLNTFALLAALTLTVHFARGGSALRLRAQGLAGGLLLVGLGLLAVLGASGAMTALGDTLFPATSLREGLLQDLSPAASVYLKLRMWHPPLAVLTGAYLSYAAFAIARMREDLQVRRAAWALSGVFAVQMAVGLLNLVLLAPVGLQLVHLLLADFTWMAFVWLAATALATDAKVTVPSGVVLSSPSL